MKWTRAGLRMAPSAFAAACLVALAPPPGDLEVAVERTELKWSREGRLLGHLVENTPLERLGGGSGWTRVEVHGWMWSASLDRAGSTYQVTPEVENLRARRNGAILGTLVRGVEVRRVGGEGKWYEIELIGWVPDGAVRSTGASAEAVGEEEAAAATSAATAKADSVPPGEEPAGAAEAPAAEVVEPSPSRGSAPPGRLAGEAGLRAVPAGEVVATLPAGLLLTPLETRGEWTRVAIEGWVPSRTVRADAGDAAGPAAVALSPEAFEGRRVTWTLEHVALQRADRWRTDFAPGEYYDLARVPGGEGRYVYLVVPNGLVEAFGDLSPFETIRVEGRIRTGRSTLTGNPILVVSRILP